MSHPNQVDLALYAGSDLGFWARLRLNGHLRRCPDCRAEVHRFQAASLELREAAAELPEDLNWARLAAEMKANIRLGYAAGEVVRPAEAPAHVFGFRQALVLASIVVLVMAGYWLNLPQPKIHIAQAAGVVLEQTADGIELQENGRSLTMRLPKEGVLTSVSAQGSIGARYVDAETGQVTISNVYMQ